MEKKKLLEVVIDRAKHLTGDVAKITQEDSMLLSGHGKTRGMMCCLGFVGKKLGVTKLVGEGTPQDTCNRFTTTYVSNMVKWQSVKLVREDSWGGNTDLCDLLINANDSTRTTPEKREARIKALGLKAGIKFVFKGRRPAKKELQER